MKFFYLHRSKIKDELDNKSQTLATKEDIRKLELDIKDTKVDLIKWIFAFWVTIILLLVGLYIRH